MESKRSRLRKAISKHKRIFISILAVAIAAMLVVVLEYEYVPSFKYETSSNSASFDNLGPVTFKSGSSPVYCVGNVTSTVFMNESGHSSFIKLILTNLDLQERYSGGYDFFAGDLTLRGHLFSNLHPKGLTLSVTVSHDKYPIWFIFEGLSGKYLNLTPRNPGQHSEVNFENSNNSSGTLLSFNTDNVTYFDFSGGYYNFGICAENESNPVWILGEIHGVTANRTQPCNFTLSFNANLGGLGRPVVASAKVHMTFWPAVLIYVGPTPNMTEVKDNKIFVEDRKNKEIWPISSNVVASCVTFVNARPYTPYMFYYTFLNGTSVHKNVTTGGPGSYIRCQNLTNEFPS